MSDLYQSLVTSPIGEQIAKRVGLPRPENLRRYTPGEPLIHGPVVAREAPGGRLSGAIKNTLAHIDADVRTDLADGERAGAIVFDATGITTSAELQALHEGLHPVIRQLLPSGRLIVFGTPPATTRDARERAAQRALEGFVRSLGKEVQRGATANLVYVHAGAEDGVDSTLRFLLSGRSAFVSGQTVEVGPALERGPVTPVDPQRPLQDQVAVVTGASRGIGEAIAEVLARDGAHVVCLDLPAQGDALAAVANRIGGSSFQLDVTADDAPTRLAEYLKSRHDGVDIVVHNAGVTRDKTLAGMDHARWDMVLSINLTAQERINDALLDDDVLNEGGRIVTVSSMSGIAGNRGQSNYAASKAGVIGMVDGLADTVAGRGATINAVAPGFIETEMTKAMPIGVREVGRRMNSLSQGGLPVDVAETIAWFAHPESSWVNGNTVRVCGQNLLGA
jgi:3-oxoacyl-[acyl-carrier protein] reductase